MSYFLIFFGFIASFGDSRTIQFYIEPAQRQNPTYVQQLVEGSLKRVEHGMRLTSSISMIYDGGHYIVVDSPSATDIHSKELMLKGIASRNIAPGEIQYVVTSHGHPDHFGQGNFFPNARHFFGSYEYSDTNFISTELHTKDIMQLTKNVQLWNTPGHTAQDITVMVHNVSCCGIVAVVGDLFYNEDDANEPAGVWFQEAWNPLTGKISRNKVICYANYIIPGHGKLFKVTEHMKKSADCHINYEIEQSASDIPAIGNTFPMSGFQSNQVLRKPAETLKSNVIQSVPDQNSKVTTTFSPVSPESTTGSFYTVNLAAETPATREENILDLQENLPPLGRKIKKSYENYIDNPDEIHPMVQSIATKFSEVLKSQNDSQVAELIPPQFRKLQTTLKSLWKQYMHANK